MINVCVSVCNLFWFALSVACNILFSATMVFLKLYLFPHFFYSFFICISSFFPLVFRCLDCEAEARCVGPCLHALQVLWTRLSTTGCLWHPLFTNFGAEDELMGHVNMVHIPMLATSGVLQSVVHCIFKCKWQGPPTFRWMHTVPCLIEAMETNMVLLSSTDYNLLSVTYVCSWKALTWEIRKL